MTTEAILFRSAAAVTAPSLDAALRSSGALKTGRVRSVRSTPIGTGQMAQSVRLTIDYDGDTDGPSSLVGKFPSEDDRSRAVGRSMRAYEIEVGFYRDLAGSLAVQTPVCHYSAFDPKSHDFVLLLEDLAPAQAGDQLDGCSADLAATVLEQAIAFHAPRWDDPALGRIAWLNRATPNAGVTMAKLIGSLLPGFLERYGDKLDSTVLAGLELGTAYMERWWAGPGGPRTLFHGDFRLDNLLIDGNSVFVVDWQTLALGNGVADISYFVGGNLSRDDRLANEEALVKEYHGQLCASDIDTLSWDECWRLYRHGAWYGVFLAVGAAMLVERTERGDRMFVTDLIRHVHHALDLDAIEVIG